MLYDQILIAAGDLWVICAVDNSNCGYRIYLICNRMEMQEVFVIGSADASGPAEREGSLARTLFLGWRYMILDSGIV